MPGGFLSMFLRFFRDDDCRRRLIACRRQGVDGFRRRVNRASARRNDYGAVRYLGRRHGAGGYRRFRGFPRRRHYSGTARAPVQALEPAAPPAAPPVTPLPVQALEPAEQAAAPLPVQAPEPAAQPGAPLVPAVEDWLLAGPAAPRLHFEPVACVVAALPPGDDLVVLDNGSMMSSSRARRQTVDMDAGAPRVGSLTRAPVSSMSNSASGSSMAAAASAQAGASASFGFTVVDVNMVAAPLPSPNPETPPPSRSTGTRSRLVALGLPLPSQPAASPSSSRSRRAGSWSPAALGLANGASNGVAPGTRLPWGSSDEEEGGQNAARRW